MSDDELACDALVAQVFKLIASFKQEKSYIVCWQHVEGHGDSVSTLTTIITQNVIPVILVPHRLTKPP